ncbi:tail protein X [Pyramidobacter piscolens]|uniref:tail protein X n=1 Tax=Pyramidobacter piscolens TaxID=638849 RepID=UPI002490FA06|nr:tail protein X [Pyramidobacter piscolens]
MSAKIKTIAGDTWDRLAKRAYGDEKMMDVLIQANPSQRMTAIFSAGATISVPETEQAVRSAPPPWRRS